MAREQLERDAMVTALHRGGDRVVDGWAALWNHRGMLAASSDRVHGGTAFVDVRTELARTTGLRNRTKLRRIRVSHPVGQ